MRRFLHALLWPLVARVQRRGIRAAARRRARDLEGAWE